MITFQNQKTFPLKEIQQIDKTISTLLVPSHLLNPLKAKVLENGNSLTIYFRNLLWKYRTLTHSGMLPSPKKIKTEYQENNLDLKRINFRVNNTDWIEIGQLSIAFGKSKCWLFVYLLEIDLSNLWEILQTSGLYNAVPTNKKLQLRVSISLRREKYSFKRNYHVKV